MSENILMSKKERNTLHVLRSIEKKRITVCEGAEELSISERHLYRILRRYRESGDAGLIHRLRGHPSNRGYSEGIIKQVLDLYRKRYPDYGPQLFSEKIAEDLHLNMYRETIRRWLLKAGLWERVRKGRRHRKKRPRRSQIGAMIQVDGSHHDWFEGRGPKCCLIVFIDDASNRSFLFFSDEETIFAALMALRLYVERYGIPFQIYLDRHSVYWSEDSETEFARVARALGIQIIYARSPQAKGRVERANRTHQDRLVKALREANISDIDSANHFLATTYLDAHNARFANTDGLTDVHRPTEERDLSNIICFEEERTVYHDMTIRIKSTFYQILPSREILPIPRQRVIIRRWLDGSLHVFWRERELSIAACKLGGCDKIRPPVTQSSSHPWYHKPVGKARYTSMADLCRPTTKSE